ncbi:hypothetical protein DET49_13821 [Salegentibacter sp. 24]|uniref:hypothetical protein n=1 Tax=Salegentibacter sp. 24 TaxID=2183986 RepID=UPI00105C9998|nr:hypothetical protein [Salegentibacter sp. 24]TDN79358.1 hypothetical protein DET49_13821 [Salegentibacter sp. 24]
MSNIYKYKEDIDEISQVCDCPNSEYFQFEEKTAFRFVFEDSEHPHNFLPPAKIKPKRYLDKSPTEVCEGLGLSLYGKKYGARQKFEELSATFKNFKKVIGTHLAKGNIVKEDGHITEEDEITHFDMYEFESADLAPKFKVIEEL